MALFLYTFILFIFGCIATRLYITWLAYTGSPTLLKTMAYLALIPATGMSIIYAKGWRKTGAETFHRPIWWNQLRPIHAFMYFMFSFQILILQNYNTGYLWLLADTFFGLTSFAIHHQHHLVSLLPK